MPFCWRPNAARVDLGNRTTTESARLSGVHPYIVANGEITLAGAAFAVALTALFIAVGQLLQQVFGTAEGYRRCQSSVLGPWARKTRLTW